MRKYILIFTSPVVIISLFYIAIIFAMLPLRNFGFQDDFAYHHMVKNLLQTGTFHINQWAGPSAVFSTYWGFLFSKFFGFSYVTLQISSLSIFYLASIAFLYLLLELHIRKSIAVIFTIAFFSCIPLLRFAFSFMTDIPYISLTVITMLVGLKALKKQSILFSFLTGIFGMLAFLTRQLGVVLPISLVLSFIILSLLRRNFFWKQILAVFIPLFSIYFLYSSWLTHGNMSLAQQSKVYAPLKITLQYLFPKNLAVLHFTNSIYYDVAYRISYFSTILFFYVTPIFLFFLFPRILKKMMHQVLRNKIGMVLGIIYTLFIIWRFAIQYNFFSHGFYLSSPEIFQDEMLWIFKNKNLNSINIIYSIIVYIFYPLWFLIGVDMINNFYKIYFRKKTKINFSLVLISTSLVFSFIIYFMYQYFSKIEHVFSFTLQEFENVLFLLLCLIVLPIFLFHYFYSQFFIGKKNTMVAGQFLFIFFCGILQVGITLFAYFSWDDYVFPIIPILLIGLGFLANKYKISIVFSSVILMVYILFSGMYLRSSYQTTGALWEHDEKLVNNNNISPYKVKSVSYWTWIPYFYQESSYNQWYKAVKGDRTKIPFETWAYPVPKN